jgi:hypothetical protein
VTSTTPKKITSNTYVKGFLLGADLLLMTATESGDGSSKRTYAGNVAQESTISLLNLANEVFGDGIELPPELPDIELFDIAISLTSIQEGNKSSTSEFEFSGKSRLSFGKKFSFAGITITPPPEVIFNFKITQSKVGDDTIKTFFLGMSMPQGSELNVSSALAWTRNLPGTEAIFREIQKDDEDQSNSDELVSLKLTALANISITLIKTTLGSRKDKPGSGSSQPPAGAAEYFIGFDPSQWLLSFKFLDEVFEFRPGQNTPAIAPEPPQAAAMAIPAEVMPARTMTNGSRNAAANGKREFSFPFLKQGDKEAAGTAAGNATTAGNKSSILSQMSQRITIRAPGKEDITFADSVFSIAIPGTIHIGSMQLDIELPVDFNIQNFAISIDPKKFEGIKVLSKAEQLPKQNLLGLEWSFFGAKVDGEDRYHHLTLVTKDFNYQLQQAPRARIEIAYTKASQDPIVFIVSDFVLGAKGLTITAEVSDRPARLNGIDTKYRFHGSKLSIVENQIQDFTLAGSGPLPPKLVGDAMVDVALQFKQVDGGLKLVAGAAQMRGNKILDCKGTRFQFSVDAIGLKFVNDGQFHLFFTLTGQARFVLGKGDSRNGALAMLPNIQIDLIDCPLTGDARVIAKHVRFLVELPKPVSFPFLGAYEFELRAIAFLPGFAPFNNDVAMQITGQIKFAQGKGDAATDKPDYHSLYIGLPKPGSFEPRLYMDRLPLDITAGEAFKLNGVVEFKDTETLKGFEGEGVLEIKGLPPMAASFGFYRTRKTEADPWVRAWFIYIEVRQISFRIPVVEFYIREVGLGFGYRYTLVGIKRADESGSLKQLLAELKVLSRTQGDLSKRDRWAIDLENQGEDPRWTIVLRAMIAQLSAAPSPLSWNAVREEELPCVYLFDAVIAFRSDLTFFMNVRGWLNTSYGMYVKERNAGKVLEPLFSGFVFLWPRQKRFLAHLASNPKGHLGSKPQLPKFVESAVRSGQFSATLLIEPALMHFELGWPNMLRWSNSLGPLQADLRGGFIFRISSAELVIGVSFLARASLRIATEINMGLVGASIEANANVAYGARYIGLVNFKNNTPYIYGAIGIEIRIKIVVALWIKIPLIFKTIKKSFDLRFEINFTAGLEFALNGATPGLRGYGTIAIRAMGHQLQFSVHLNAGENNVKVAKQKTEKYLNIGLEATEVESVPGLEAPARPARMAAMAMRRTVEESVEESEEMAIRAALSSEAANHKFDEPNYDVYVIRNVVSKVENEAEKTHHYFVLLPRSVANGGNPGFLPVPPESAILPSDVWDFKLVFDSDAAFTLEQFSFNNSSTIWTPYDLSQTKEISWKANWQATVVTDASDSPQVFTRPTDSSDQGTPIDEVNSSINSQSVNLKLDQYLTQAYLTNGYDQPSNGAGGSLENVYPIQDPEPLPSSQPLEDERVQNPSDNAFEAAVRGAQEQFSGSPFFKHDPNHLYEKNLEAAFSPNTTIYDGENGNGTLNLASEEQQKDAEQNQQAHQIRSLVINSLIEDLQRYVEASAEQQAELTQTSIVFQMGLVFRVEVDKAPEWLETNTNTEPKIYQRTTRQTGLLPSENESAEQERRRRIHTFNTRQTSFATNPPQFQRVKHFTDANTIAITWDLVQTYADTERLTDLQKDPEQHLSHYEVRRRSLDGRDPETVYRVKSAAVLHKEENASFLTLLKPRFQVVDHFTAESLDDVASLPTEGRSYLYSITPIDFAGNAGHPLTLVATRYPNEPPQVPVDAELQIQYHLTADDIKLYDMGAEKQPENLSAPRVIEPTLCQVTWVEPPPPRTGPTVAIDDYFLVFRRETTLPIGSYGLDSSTQQPRTKLLPTSNARPLQTDIKIKLQPQGLSGGRSATIPLTSLSDAGIFPPSHRWQPDSWRVYFQTVSTNGVPSALAPVQLLLVFQSEAQGKNANQEERRPATLEWLPQPIRLALLPPEDQRAIVGEAHFPMPKAGAYRLSGSNPQIHYQPHPAGLGCIRFRWNQGPSHLRNYPLNLTASYDLLQLDIDANTTETFADAEKLANALRQIQDVQMMDAADQLLTPGDTLATNRWEAWYPSLVQRRKRFAEQPVEGAEVLLSPWYSWRDSILEWPEWTGLTNTGLTDEESSRSAQLHPLLLQLVERLSTSQDGTLGYSVDLQTVPPMQPQSFATFRQTTAPTADPYGWGILQRFGLSMTFSLRDANSGAMMTGTQLLNQLQTALNALTNDPNFKHLFVELLIQPGHSVNLEVAQVNSTALLGIVQVSLRPVIQQVRFYGVVNLSATAGSEVKLRFTFSQPFGLINQANLSAGIAQFQPTGTSSTVEHTLTMPLTGEVSLLMQGSMLPERIEILLKDGTSPILVPIELFAPTDNRSTYFTIAVSQLAQDFSQAVPAAQVHWLRFKRYAESLNSTDPKQSDQDDKIDVPTTGDALRAILPEVLEWLQRFFDASGLVEDGQSQSPWLATAYPRISTPAPVVPDASGRLTYDHLLPDQWAHNYRFYIRPNDRYSLLWQSLLQSSILSLSLLSQTTSQTTSRTIGIPEAQPDPEAAGLDVVLDRIRPIDAPVVLNSARLDPPALPQQPVPPGSIWEVIVAQHHEQALIERNQTLARQLSFRQVAFTLVRRLSQPTWNARLTALMRFQGSQPDQTEILLVENQYPDSPNTYPSQPDHLNVNALEAADHRSLDLPNRIGNFQQGAMVLQWEALPFYYEHQLLLIAQTDRVVSPINSVTQQNFEYRSPKPIAIAQGADALPVWLPPEPFAAEPLTSRARHLQLPLQRFWDSLPDSAQTRWCSEKPQIQGAKQTFSALPDPDVVYQLIQIAGGNIEVQAEILLAPDKANADSENQERYQIRQFGKHFFAQIMAITPPSVRSSQTDSEAALLLESDPEFYTLNLALRQISQVSLQRFYVLNDLPQPAIRQRLHFDPATKILSVIDVFSQADYDALWSKSVEEFGLLDDEGKSRQTPYPCRIVAQKLTSLPAGFDYLNHSIEDIKGYTFLSLTGQLDAAQKEEVRRLAEDCDALLREALLALINQSPITNPSWGRIAHSPANHPDPPLWVAAVKPFKDFPSLVSASLSLDSATETQLIWMGAITSAQATELRTRFFDPPIVKIITELQAATIEQDYTDRQTATGMLPIPDSLWTGTFKIQQSSAHSGQWMLVWVGEMDADNIETLSQIAPVGDLRTGIRILIEGVLLNQKRYINEQVSQNEQLRAYASQIDEKWHTLESLRRWLNEGSMSDSDRAAAEAGKASLESEIAVIERAMAELLTSTAESTVANQKWEAAVAKFRELFPRADLTAIEATHDRQGSIAKTTFSTTVVWRLTKAAVVSALRGKGFADSAALVDQRLTIPENSAQPMQWTNLYDLDITLLANQTTQALDPQDPLHAHFLAVFQKLVQQITAHKTQPFAYRPQQEDCPISVRSHLILQGHLLWGQRYPDSVEREALLNQFASESRRSTISAEVDKKAVLRLLNDLQDQQTLEALYRRWLSQVTVSEAFARAVFGSNNRPQNTEVGYILQWNQETVAPSDRLLSQENRDALNALTGDAAFKSAIQRLIKILDAQKPKIHRETVVLRGEGFPSLPQLQSTPRLTLTWVLRYHGLMTVAERQQLLDLLPSGENPATVQTLFATSMTESLRGGDLRVMTRRSSAKPSELIPIDPKTLPAASQP